MYDNIGIMTASKTGGGVNEPIRLPQNDVYLIENSRSNARQYYARRLQRCIENWRFYWAHDAELGLGQWPQEVVEWMISQKRQLTQYNFCKVIIDTIAGGIMQIPFDPEFYPVDEEVTELTHAIKKAMYSDKELLNWDISYFNLVRDGLVHEGVIKMFISREWNDLGNIGFMNMLPGSVMFDPNWKAWEGSKCKVAWVDSWHTAEDLIQKYPEKEALIKWRLLEKKRSADQYHQPEGPTPYVNQESDLLGSVHRLTQEYRMITKTVEEEYAPTADEGDVLIPPELSALDKPHWLNAFHPTWEPTAVYKKPKKKKLCVIRAIAPTVSQYELLENGLSEIQIGRLPLFRWAASQANGETDTPMDSIKDPQKNINYWMSTITHKLQVEGDGGSQFADPGGFANRQMFEDYVANRNDPTKVFETRPNMLVEGRPPAVPTMKSAFPAEAFQMINHMINVILPNIAKVTPATRGMKESSGESGKLFELLKIQSDQQLYTIHYGLRLFWNEVYEAYFLQAVNTYSNEDEPRKFTFNKGKQSIALNEEVNFADGSVGMRNRVANLKRIRHKVIVSENQQSPTEKMDSLERMSRFIKSVGVNSPLITKFLINEAATLMTMFDDEKKEQIRILGDIDLQTMVQEAITKQKQMKAQELQADQLIQQYQNAAGGQQPGQQLGQQPTQMPQANGQIEGLPSQISQVPEAQFNPRPLPRPISPAEHLPNSPTGQELGA